MSTATVSIDQTSLSLAALAIVGGGTTYRLTERGLGRPSVSWRLRAMPDSDAVHGTEFTAAAKEQSSLPLEVRVQGSSAGDLASACDALEAALSQFTYETTVTVDAVGRVWTCAPASWSTGLVLSDESAAFFTVYSVTIPVYPIPGA